KWALRSRRWRSPFAGLLRKCAGLHANRRATLARCSTSFQARHLGQDRTSIGLCQTGFMMEQERMARPLSQVDPEIYDAIEHEVERQHAGLELIGSENFTSEAVLEATGSVFTNK